MKVLRNLWRDARWYEKIMLLALPVGTLGLTTHYWCWAVFLLALPRLRARDCV